MSELKKKMMYSSDQVFNDLLASMCNKLFRLDIIRSFYEDLNTDIAYEEDAAFVYTYILKCSSAVMREGVLSLQNTQRFSGSFKLSVFSEKCK